MKSVSQSYAAGTRVAGWPFPKPGDVLRQLAYASNANCRGVGSVCVVSVNGVG